MASQWAQTNFRHNDKEVQREFERKSSPVISTNIQQGTSSTQGYNGSPSDNTSDGYTIYHNGLSVNTVNKNRSINFSDLSADISNMQRVEFSLSALGDSNGEDVTIEAYYAMPEIPSDGMFYSEEFFTDKYFANEPHARMSDLTPNYIKFGTTLYHDVKHNFGLNNQYEVFWSITYIGDSTCKCIPVVIPIDGNTMRVYSSTRYDLSSEWQYLNTDLMSMPVEEMISKESLPKFFISVHAIIKEIIQIIHGGFPNTIDYISILNGGNPNTTNYSSIIIGGNP